MSVNNNFMSVLNIRIHLTWKLKCSNIMLLMVSYRLTDTEWNQLLMLVKSLSQQVILQQTGLSEGQLRVIISFFMTCNLFITQKSMSRNEGQVVGVGSDQ